MRSVDFNSIAQTVDTVNDYDLEMAFLRAAKASVHDEQEYSVFRLLMGLCSMHLNVDDPAQIFGPKAVFTNGRRTAIPEDYQGDQNEAVYQVLTDVRHPALRARLADTVWLNDKKKGRAAKIAIDAYCECVEGLRSGRFKAAFDMTNAVSLEMTDLLRRASQIHSASSKRGAPLSEHATKLVLELHEDALSHALITALVRLTELVFRYDLLKFDAIATSLEAVANSEDQNEANYPIATQKLFEFAAYAYDRCGDDDGCLRCRLSAAGQNIRMARQMGTASAAAHWIRQAIKVYQAIPGTTERREQLRKELRDLQEKSLEEFATFTTPIELDDLINETEFQFDQLNLSESLLTMALMAKPENSKRLRESVLKTDFGLSSMFGATHLDGEGKIIAQVEASGRPGDEPSERWLKSKIVEQIGLRIQICIKSGLEPARLRLSELATISERHFEPIVYQSPFVPQTHRSTLTLGFTRLFQGDVLSAGALLIPQLEHCIRHVLMISNLETWKMRDDLIQEDRSLSALYDLYRDNLVSVFGEDIVFYIELIFLHRPGAALRHEFAHGKIGDSGLFDPSVRFACYFIFYLTCAPLFGSWSTRVAPHLEL